MTALEQNGGCYIFVYHFHVPMTANLHSDQRKDGHISLSGNLALILLMSSLIKRKMQLLMLMQFYYN